MDNRRFYYLAEGECLVIYFRSMEICVWEKVFEKMYG